MKLQFITGLLLSASVFAAVVKAQSPSPSSIRDAVRDQVQQELAQIQQAVAKKAYVGSITAIDNLTITVSNLKNQSRTAVVTTDTTIRLLAGGDGTVGDLKTGDFVIAMGDADSNGVLTTKRLLVIGQPASDRRETVFLTVTGITTSSLTGTTTAGTEWTVNLSSTTDYLNDLTRADIQAEDKIIVAGTTSATSTLSAGVIQKVSE